MAAEGDGEAAGPGQALTRGQVDAIERFARQLAKGDLTFLAVRDELYGGSWAEIEEDLRARLDGKPFIFKLAGKIEETLERIERLKRFEDEHGVDLRQVAQALGVTGR